MKKNDKNNQQISKEDEINFNKPQNFNENNIFELLKDIKELNKNKELIGYFKFADFYCLLDPRNKIAYQEVSNLNTKKLKTFYSGMTLTFLSSYVFYKRNYPSISQYCLVLGCLPVFYLTYQTEQEINYLLLEMKDDYIYRVDKFFKEGGENPLTLNPNFLAEDIIDPDLRKYAEFLKLNSLKKSNIKF
jgi:hypothetical protein